MDIAKQANQPGGSALPGHVQSPARRDRLIRLPDVEAATGCKKSTIYLLLKQGKFPKPIRLSARMVAWQDTAVQKWIQDRIAEGVKA